MAQKKHKVTQHISFYMILCKLHYIYYRLHLLNQVDLLGFFSSETCIIAPECLGFTCVLKVMHFVTSTTNNQKVGTKL